MRALELIDRHWLIYLGVTAGWATLFSFFNSHPPRGLRNFGILGAYAVGLVMAIRLPWRNALATWAVFAIAGGLLYFSYEAITYARSPREVAKPKLATLVNGFVAWPLMLPEVVEYSLAGAGILKGAATPAAGEVGDSGSDEKAP